MAWNNCFTLDPDSLRLHDKSGWMRFTALASHTDSWRYKPFLKARTMWELLLWDPDSSTLTKTKWTSSINPISSTALPTCQNMTHLSWTYMCVCESALHVCECARVCLEKCSLFWWHRRNLALVKTISLLILSLSLCCMHTLINNPFSYRPLMGCV